MVERDEERGRRLRKLFFEAVDLPPEQHAAFLDLRAADDPALRERLAELLAEPADGEGSFLEDPALQVGWLEAQTPPAEHDSPDLPKQIGRYEILGVLGQGGMGTVFEARQQEPDRKVALKVVHAGIGFGDVHKRFRREAQILGRLHHPGIAQVYEAGTTGEGGQPFFAMELVRGKPLDAYVRARQLDTKGCLELVAHICDAVDHAHQSGVVHRDLKPANILVEADGSPKVLDFGVAHLSDPDRKTLTLQTRTGQLIGTLSYMSPEQVAGGSSEVDARSDVYSLGVVLYELLANHLPHDLRDRSIPEAVRIIGEDDPERLTKVHTRYRGDVDTIVAKALAKEPARRYASAAELAADIRHFLKSEPIVARPTSSVYYISKFARRHKGLVGGIVATLVVLTLGVIMTTWFAFREIEARERADQRTSDALRASYRSNLAAAAAALRDGNTREAARLLAEVEGSPFRGWEWKHYDALLDGSTASSKARPERGFKANYPKRLLYFTADGWVVHLPRYERKGDDPILVWNPDTGERIERMLGIAGFLAPYDDGARLAYVGKNFRIESTRSGEAILERAAADLWDAEAADWKEVDIGEGLRSRSIEGVTFVSRPGSAYWQQNAAVGWITPLSDERAYFSGAGRGAWTEVWDVSELWDVQARARVGAVPAKPHAGVRLGFLGPRHERWATFSNESFRLYFAAAVDRGPFDWIEAPVSSRTMWMDFHPHGHLVATGSADGMIRLWDPATGRLVESLGGHVASVYRVRFSPDGSRLASVSQDGTVRVWDLGDADDPRILVGHESYVYPVAFSPDGARIASASWDGTVRFWDAATGDPIAAVSLPRNSPRAGGLAYLDRDRLFVAASAGGGKQRYAHHVIDTRTGGVEAAFDQPKYTYEAWSADPRVAFDTGSAQVFVADQGAVTAWDAKARRVLPLEVTGQRAVSVLARDGTRWLATGTKAGGEVALWDLRSQLQLATLEGDAGQVTALAFRPDGERLAAVFEHGTKIWIWDTATRELIVALPQHAGRIYDIVYSPDGRRLASAGQDRTVRIWNAETHEELATLSGHRDYVWSLAWSPDGRRLASGSGDATVRVWDAEPLGVRRRAGRDRRQFLATLEPTVQAAFTELGESLAVLERLEAELELNEREREIAAQRVLQLALEME